MFKEHMIVDYLRNHDEQSSINLALHDLNRVFAEHGTSCSTYNLPEPTVNASEEPTIDQKQQQIEAERLINTLNPEEQQAFEK